MPNYTTISAGSTATISVPAGSTLKVSGSGTAQIVPPGVPGTDNAQRAVLGELSFGPHLVACSVSVVAGSSGARYYTMAAGDAVPAGAGQSAAGPLSSDALQALVSGAGITPHPRYWFHGFAPWQAADSGRFRDIVAGNHGVFGANLSRAQAWTALASGYVSTVDPVGGSTDPVIRIPGPNFDYNGGESLLVLWSGQVTPEGADASLMGTAHSTAQKGLRIRVGSTGRLSFVLHDTAPTSLFSTSTTDNALGKPFVSGEAHTFAMWINGSTRKTSMWVDGLINVNELTISSAAACDTLSSNTWNIGAASPSPGGTEGIATKTHAFAGLKFLATDTLPTIEQLTAVVQAFDRAPHALIAKGAL